MPSELHVRSFPLDLEVREDTDDGLIVTGVVVPYNEVAEIVEPRPDGVIRYREQFIAGAFERAVKAPHRVALQYEHVEQFQNRLGFGRQFRDSAEGLIGSFRLDASQADHARDVLSTSHNALSVGFISVWPRPGTELAGSLVLRKSVALMHVAAVSAPAYSSALITGFRSQPEDFGEPTAADLEAQAQLRADDDLRAFFHEHAEFSIETG